MARYIDAEKIEYYEEYIGGNIINNVTYKSVIDRIPTADVQKVKHGVWYMEQRHVGTMVAMMPPVIETVFVCSECSRVERQKEPYCNCGAKMDLEG